MGAGKKKISRSFQNWLHLLVVIAFAATTAFLWLFQTRLSENNAINLLELNIRDIVADINDASDANLLALSNEIAKELDAAPEITNELLFGLAESYDVSEINYIDSQGIIRASTYPDFLDYHMESGAQSGEFMVLLKGQREYVQAYGPVSFDANILRKYGGVVLQRGGFVQVGYDAVRFQQDVSQAVIGVAKNRHIGEEGSVIVASKYWDIVSDRYGNEGKHMAVTGLWLHNSPYGAGEPFTETVYGVPCYCMYQEAEGYIIVAVIPCSEAALSRNVSVGVTTVMQIIIFTALFVLIYFLVKKLVVDNIHKINSSLASITDGRLDTVVDVRSHVEFAALSDDINSTVDTLKRYISDAEARIDAELAFAKAIQHSALPSVFPPFPARKEFEIWASMITAKEVGGDFYDFYFLDDHTLAFLVADVSGKGIPAAMFMMTAKTLLKSCAESGMDVAQVLTQANNKLCEGNEAGMFVTVWMGYLNTRTGLVTYANAGHNPPLLRRGDGTVEYVKCRPGLVLAGMEGIRYRTNTLQLESGDMLYLYTDGVTEATDTENRLYGEERLKTVLETNPAQVENICAQVKADVDAFVGEAPQFDDITMLSLQYKNNGEETQ